MVMGAAGDHKGRPYVGREKNVRIVMRPYGAGLSLFSLPYSLFLIP